MEKRIREINTLQNRRENLKAQLDRFNRFLDAFEEDNSATSPTTQALTNLDLRYQSSLNIWERIMEIQSRIEDILSTIPSSKDPGTTIQEEQSYISLLETENFEILTKAKCLLAKYQPNIIPPQGSSQSYQSFNSPQEGNKSTTNINSIHPQFNVRLPQFNLPEFNGVYEQWYQFHDLFKSCIHDNDQLTSAQKFYYLLSAVKGDAAEIIRNLEVSENNYQIAWDLLKSRFDNKKQVVRNHLKQIMDLASVTKESNTTLRQFLDKFLTHYRLLKTFDLHVDKWDTLLIHILNSKLDYTTKREWESVTCETDFPSINTFIDFLTARCKLLESLHAKPTIIIKGKLDVKPQSHVTNHKFTTSCPVCKGTHAIYKCERFLALSTQERFNEIKSLKLCTNCLRTGHQTKLCNSSKCRKCNRSHNTLLHMDTSMSHDSNTVNEQSVGDQAQSVSTTVTHSTSNSLPSFVLLSTAVIFIRDQNNKFVKARALLDNGSQSNFMTKRLQNRLNLRTKKIDLPIAGINMSSANVFERTTTQIQSQYYNYKSTLSFLVINQITGNIPQISINKDSISIPSNINLADPQFHESRAIDILIGASIFYDLLLSKQIKLGNTLPILQATKLGWLVSGPITQNFNSLTQCNLVTNLQLNDQLQKFWSIEEPVNSHKILSQEESECEDNFIKNVSRDPTGRFIIALPVKNNIHKLGSSEELAIQRLKSMEHKMSKNAKLKADYIAFMDEYLKLGHMSLIDPDKDSPNDIIYYLPHHCIIKESSLTTKLRVVFDGSAKSNTNISLNDILKIGPVVQSDLISILLKFRMHSIVFTSDVTKMYRQILVKESQRNLQRIVWRDNPEDSIRHYQLNTITYGTASASFLSTRCLKQISIENERDYPLASQIISDDFYVDDLISGASNIKEAKRLISEISSLLIKYGFPLCKWSSNIPEILDHVDSSQTLKSLASENHINKTLGILWNPNNDQLCYAGVDRDKNTKISNTKRSILSIISQIFDPLGLIGPVIIKAKLILQQLWKLQIGWDDIIPSKLQDEWKLFYEEIDSLTNIKIPRQVLQSNIIRTELHIFCDASELAYGAVAYLRSISQDGTILIRLIYSKSRVAPLKTLSLPRLELCAALLASQMINKISTTLMTNLHNIYLWSDSMIVLYWINSCPSNLKTFVATRITEILNTSSSSQWRHVASADNPADIISRGLNPNKLYNTALWWNGPSWLWQNMHSWPNTTIDGCIEVPETKPTVMTVISQTTNELITRYSSYSKLLRITAYLLRFVNRIHSKDHFSKFITITELKLAEIKVIQIVQAQCFQAELECLHKNKQLPHHSKLIPLNPFLDDHNIIRVGGRLRNSNLSYLAKFPILLPKNHELTRLIISEQHQLNFHAGPQFITACVRRKFWPLGCRQTVKQIIKQCVKCFKVNPAPMSYPMGDLPKARITPSKPFLLCGTDYAGPFLIRDGKLRNRKLIKSYLCIFICLTTKAVHFELVTELTTNAFLNALKRFVARRGLSTDIYSDNGTNYVGAERELREIIQLVKNESIQNYSNQRNIQWHFIPPRGPNFGGLWEAAVKSAKYHLKRVVSKGQTFIYEDFYTILCQIESLLNSRPLYPMTDDPNDFEPLTPGHFLIGQSMEALPEADTSHLKDSHLSRYQVIQKFARVIWKRWSHEYLHQLQQRTKWKFEKAPESLLGALVVVIEDNMPPNAWLMGRIVDIHPGSDNIVRVVTVQTTKGIIKRPTTKVSILPVEVVVP